jgi:hypothetical protein
LSSELKEARGDNPHREHASRQISDVLAGRSEELQLLSSSDPDIRKLVAAELQSAIVDSEPEKQERARQLFIDHGYLDEVVRDLREASSYRDRAFAARTLGQLGSRLGTTPLIAALFDSEAEVREAATAALTRIGDPSVVIGPTGDRPSATTAEPESQRQPDVTAQDEGYTPDPPKPSELEQLIEQEISARQAGDRLDAQLREIAASLDRALEEARERARRESQIREEIIELRFREEELQRRIGTIRLAEAHDARAKTQELYSIELERLRTEGEALARATEEAALRRADLERARRAAEEQSQQLVEERARLDAEGTERATEAERLRREAEEQNRVEQEQLRSQITTLRRTAEALAARRMEIAAARKQAENEAQQLAEEHARMQAAEETRRKTEAERLQLEAELLQRVEEERRLVAEATARVQTEQRRVEEEAERRAAEAESRLAEVANLRQQQEIETRRRVEREQAILHETQRLAEMDAEARKRIEQADLRRRAAEDSQRQAEEKAVKIEAEARVKASEEEQALTKLEAVKRKVAAEVQARVDQEKRIRGEIEQLRKLEAEARSRIEEETLRRVEAESELEQQREKFRLEETARLKAEVQHLRLVEQPVTEAEDDWRDEPGENLRPVKPLPGVNTQLQDTDASTRAAALDALARTEAGNAFGSIASSFDDGSAEVRNAAARAMMQIDPKRPVEWFTKAFEEGSTDRRRNIGLAIAESGLASEAVNSLSGSTREDTYNSLCLLFLMAKTGEVQPLVKAIEEHKDLEVRRAAIRLLTLSGQSDVADAAVKRRLNSSEK